MTRGPRTIASFFKKLDDLSNVGWAWRGEPSRFPASKPTLGRANLPEDALVQGEAHLIAEFRLRAGTFLTPNDIELTRTIWGTLVLMQHHRAPTRILDWTLSPWVAAYFAALRLGEDGFIFGFEQGRLPQLHKGLPEFVGAPSFTPLLSLDSLPEWQAFMSRDREAPWLGALQPSRAPHRVAAQQGLFTFGNRIDMDHRAWLEDKMPEAVRTLILRKDLKADVLKRLARMNITAATLFPDLGGAAQSVAEIFQALMPTVGMADDWSLRRVPPNQ